MTLARCTLWSLVAVIVGPCVVSFAPLVRIGVVRGQQRLDVLAKNVLFAAVDGSEEVPISVEEPSSKKSPKLKPLVDSMIETAWDLDAKFEEMVARFRLSKSPTLGDKFPNLVGSTQSTDSFDLYKYLGDNWGVVFMHPSEFILLLMRTFSFPLPMCTTLRVTDAS
jgi:hypothetical protein